MVRGKALGSLWCNGGNRSRWHRGVGEEWRGSPEKLQMLNLRQRSPHSLRHEDCQSSVRSLHGGA